MAKLQDKANVPAENNVSTSVDNGASIQPPHGRLVVYPEEAPYWLTDHGPKGIVS
jgi:hypothetical protein